MVEGPFSSEINTWLGFQVYPCVPIVDFPIGKKRILGALLQCIMDGQPFSSKDIEKALKRLSWATSARPLSRPFLYTSGGLANLSDPLQSCCSLCFTILKLTLALTTPHRDASAHPDGGESNKRAHLLVPTRFPSMTTIGHTKMGIPLVEFLPWRCSAL